MIYAALGQCRADLDNQNLQFVPETGTARPRGTLRDLIRSNARRKPRRRPKKASQTKLHPLLVKEKDSTATELFQTNERPAFLVERQPGVTALSLPRSPERNATDPFYTLPISDAGRSQFLTYHCEFVPDLSSRTSRRGVSP